MAASLERIGARPVVADVLDRTRLLAAITGLSADAIINQLTALKKPPITHGRMALTNELRVQGTANLLAVAERLGSPRFVTQSMIFGYGYRKHGPTELTEDSAFGVPSGQRTDPHTAAMLATEKQAFSAPHGMALRYGLFYGAEPEEMRRLLARRLLPVTHGGCLGFVHIEDAAAATVAAVERGQPGEAYNVVDNLPATWEQVFTAMATALDQPKPIQVPGWLLRLLTPYLASFVVDTSMRVSNTKAKLELGWTLTFPTYHAGIRAMVEALTDRGDAARRGGTL